jgi:hypothetical protein
MSDESSRSARPYGQRRNDGAPTWWAALDRADLPDNEVLPAAHRRWYEDAEQVAPGVAVAGRAGEPVHTRRRWLIAVLVAAVIALVLAVEWMVDSEALFDTLLIGIPAALAVTVTVVVARRAA